VTFAEFCGGAKMSAYTELVQGVRTAFRSGRTLSLEWRRQQLRGLMQMLEDHRDVFDSALRQDLNKPKAESFIMEVNFVRSEVVHALDHLSEWTKPEKVSRDLMTMMDDAYIKYEPFGVILILGAWNYPIQLTLGPIVGALAAGNCVVLKPSEVSENTAKLLEQLCPKYLDKDCVRVVNGGVSETTDLLKERFDFIFYTGNSQVAKVIYEAAAKYLTPVTLELGGKSPAYIDRTSDLEIVARRLLWGKFVNCGQTCIAPDYVLCTPDVQGPLVEACKSTLRSFYGEDPQASDSFGRMVNQRHFNRVKSLLESTSGRVVVGGKTDEQNNYIAPTILVDVKLTDSIMKEEIFGPLLPIINVRDVDEAIEIINNREKPLALYVFSKDKQTVKSFQTQTSSGGMTVNDTLMHFSLPTLPFGGVGNSGMGGYHGKFSFDTFSHKRGCLVRAQNMEKLNDVRYPPYSEKKLGLVSWVMKRSPKSSGKVLTTFLPIAIIGLLIGYVLKLFGGFFSRSSSTSGDLPSTD
jgi:aldehyde dehydrogenase (NAD+)